jgi:glycosyltransferase involved in cell wall biosynthesis
MRIAVLMPVFNEGTALEQTLAAVAAQAGPEMPISVFLVDDGSSPAIAPRVPRRPHFALTIARHRTNLGQGAALETARQLGLRLGPFDCYVMMDSDGQHRASDLPRFASAVAEGADVVFGSRFLGIESRSMPRGRRLLLRAARTFERVVTGLALSDAHNGYRAFSHRGIQSVELRQNRMAHATEIKIRVSRNKELVVREIAVEIDYTPETLRKGQSSLGALTILRDLVYGYLFGGR